MNPAVLPSTATIVVGAAVLGAIVGSFVGAALERLPAGRSVVTGRSRCDHCSTALSIQDLLPVVSWLALKGRCRTCGGPIGGWQLFCEVAAAGIGAAAAVFAAPGAVLAAMAFGWQLVLLALLDLRHLWLPRLLTALLATSGLMLAVARSVAGHDPAPLITAVQGGALGWGVLALVAAVYRIVRKRDGMGGGDPPLLGAIGLWMGPVGVIHVMLGGALVGLVAALALRIAGRSVGAGTALPLGSCLAVAAWPLFLASGFA